MLPSRDRRWTFVAIAVVAFLLLAATPSGALASLGGAIDTTSDEAVETIGTTRDATARTVPDPLGRVIRTVDDTIDVVTDVVTDVVDTVPTEPSLGGPSPPSSPQPSPTGAPTPPPPAPEPAPAPSDVGPVPAPAPAPEEAVEDVPAPAAPEESPPPPATTDDRSRLPSPIERAALPLLLFVLGGLFLAVQDQIDRRDPKLMLAPVQASPDLPFHDPRAGTGA